MKRIILPLLLVSILCLQPMQALAFDPNYILSDEELTDAYALSKDQVQAILNRGYLGNYVTQDYNGTTKTAADIIVETAQNVGINPKFLLVLLQKEQSLIEDDEPTENQLDWATGYAVCDDCSKSDPKIQRWRGFGKQVNSAALQFVEGYLEDIATTGKTQGVYGPNIPVKINNTTVIPENAATAALYAYTPHLHGNENFAKIWADWFETHNHPNGSLLQVSGESTVWLIENGYKRPINSMSALMSRFNPERVITVPKTQLTNYPTGRSIDFPNYSLLKDESGHIYLLVDDALRHIDSMETFRKIGFNLDEIVDISNEDLASFDRATIIDQTTLVPQGTVMKIAGSGALFFVENGKRHLILDEAIIDARFPNATIKTVESVEVEQFEEGRPLLLPDGLLVKNPTEPFVYVISDQQKRLIPDESTFTGYGWAWNDIVVISDVLLKRHQTGTAIPSASFGIATL